MSIGVAIITHNAKRHLRHCIPPLLESSLQPKILVVNSSSNDGTVEEAQQLGVETLVIPRHCFNHGHTREMARQWLKTDIVVMMTPDAYPTSRHILELLVRPLLEGHASIAYARQIPHVKANIFEAFAREFNYPSTSHIRSIADLSHWGVYTFFCSNSCCAYRTTALDEIGGFPPVLLGEDTVVAAKLLRLNHKIAYVAEAVVRHSHQYSLLDEFRRHFDTGYARKQRGHDLDFGVKDSVRGLQYARKLLTQIRKQSPFHLPYACLHLFAKWAGYQLGRASLKAPTCITRQFSSQDFYWNSDCFKKVNDREDFCHRS